MYVEYETISNKCLFPLNCETDQLILLESALTGVSIFALRFFSSQKIGKLTRSVLWEKAWKPPDSGRSQHQIAWFQNTLQRNNIYFVDGQRKGRSGRWWTVRFQSHEACGCGRKGVGKEVDQALIISNEFPVYVLVMTSNLTVHTCNLTT